MPYKPFCGVYCVEHKDTGRKYFGSSVRVMDRLLRHKRMLRAGTHHSPHLQAAFNKYGENSFDFKVVVKCVPEQRLFIEQGLVNAYPDNFNGRQIVSPNYLLGKKLSEEHKKKISEGLLKSEKYRRGMDRKKGKPLPRWITEKAAAVNKGRPKTQKQIQATIESNKRRAKNVKQLG